MESLTSDSILLSLQVVHPKGVSGATGPQHNPQLSLMGPTGNRAYWQPYPAFPLELCVKLGEGSVQAGRYFFKACTLCMIMKSVVVDKVAEQCYI